jgi:hypothetical protein
MIETSADVLLFEVGDAEQGVIRSWSAHNGEVQTLGALISACRLRGAVWIDTLLRVAQARAGTTVDAAYVLADLDGSSTAS